MIDQNELLIRAVAKALDDSGLSPEADIEDAKEFVRHLRELGYELAKAPPEPEDEGEDDEDEDEDEEEEEK